MKKVFLWVTMFFVASLATAVGAAGSGADWRELAAEAYTQADLVMQGTVQSVDDQTEVDGGHVYSLQVTSQQKGAPEEYVLVRAGGFFYRVQLEIGDSVLVFLKSTSGGQSMSVNNSRNQGRVYSLVEVATLRPMVFRVSETDARPVDNRLQQEFANVTNKELDELLSAIKP